MKRIVFIIMIALISLSAQAQTYDQTQARVDQQVAKLENRLSEIKERIYYLEVSLDKEIYELSRQTVQNVIVKSNLEKKQEEKHFAAEDVINLKAEKVEIEKGIKSLKETGLAGTEYRTERDMKSNLPEQMSPRQYKRYTRSLSYKLSEGMIGTDGTNSSSVNQFKGVLINDKTGFNEITTFYITRTDVQGLPTISIDVDPGKRKTWLLPAGVYQVEIVCGAYKATKTFHVDPRQLNWVDNDYAYFGIRKTMSDW